MSEIDFKNFIVGFVFTSSGIKTFASCTDCKVANFQSAQKVPCSLLYKLFKTINRCLHEKKITNEEFDNCYKKRGVVGIPRRRGEEILHLFRINNNCVKLYTQFSPLGGVFEREFDDIRLTLFDIVIYFGILHDAEPGERYKELDSIPLGNLFCIE